MTKEIKLREIIETVADFRSREVGQPIKVVWTKAGIGHVVSGKFRERVTPPRPLSIEPLIDFIQEAFRGLEEHIDASRRRLLMEFFN